jgi:hypothetical protein
MEVADGIAVGNRRLAPLIVPAQGHRKRESEQEAQERHAGIGEFDPRILVRLRGRTSSQPPADSPAREHRRREYQGGHPGVKPTYCAIHVCLVNLDGHASTSQ